jgi:hypothetical protein
LLFVQARRSREDALRWNAALVLTGMVPLAHAQTEPAKPIRFLVRSAESRRRRSVASGPQHQGADSCSST